MRARYLLPLLLIVPLVVLAQRWVGHRQAPQGGGVVRRNADGTLSVAPVAATNAPPAAPPPAQSLPVYCATGELRCGAECIDPQRSPVHCGGCGHACADNERCAQGRCVEVRCAPGELACGKVCYPADHPDHCGACDRRCAEGQSCRQGRCVGAAARLPAAVAQPATPGPAVPILPETLEPPPPGGRPGP